MDTIIAGIEAQWLDYTDAELRWIAKLREADRGPLGYFLSRPAIGASFLKDSVDVRLWKDQSLLTVHRG